jgi:hypothetical protein
VSRPPIRESGVSPELTAKLCPTSIGSQQGPASTNNPVTSKRHRECWRESGAGPRSDHAKEVIGIEPTTVDVNLDVAPIPVPAWAWLLVLAAVLGVYLMAMANATVLRQGATVLHEFFHDGRHFLSFPCH